MKTTKTTASSKRPESDRIDRIPMRLPLDWLLPNVGSRADDPMLGWVDLTPELAQICLEHMIGFNRKENKPRIASMAGDIKNRAWDKTGEALIFDDYGWLINGQNRCLAVIAAGVPIRTAVVIGVKRKAFINIDQGSKRSSGLALQAYGIVNAATVASITNAIYAATRGARPTMILSKQVVPSTKDRQDFLNLHPEIHEIAPRAKRLSKAIGVAPQVWGWALWETMKISPTLADDMFEKLEHGTNLGQGHPCLILREKMRKARNDKAVHNIGAPRAVSWIPSLMICWNLLRAGKTSVRSLSGKMPEKFN